VTITLFETGASKTSGGAEKGNQLARFSFHNGFEFNELIFLGKDIKFNKLTLTDKETSKLYWHSEVSFCKLICGITA